MASKYDPQKTDKNSEKSWINISSIPVDSPTTIDVLGYREFAFPLINRIKKSTESDTPLTIGIYGEWGSGKTSFLRIIEEQLKEDRIYPIWFNAWKYNKEEDLWSALLQTIFCQTQISGSVFRRIRVRLSIWLKDIDWKTGLFSIAKQVFPPLARFFCLILIIGLITAIPEKDALKWFLELTSNHLPTEVASFSFNIFRLFIIALVALSAAPDAAVALFDKKLGLDFKKFTRKSSYRGHIAFLDSFSQRFEEIVHMTNMGRPLVIIIDDLDRCLPEKAIQVIESIKLFLDVKNCIFLLAVDRDLIEKAISLKFSDLSGTAETCNRSGGCEEARLNRCLSNRSE